MSATGTTAGTQSGYPTGTIIMKIVMGIPDAVLYPFTAAQKNAIGAIVDRNGRNFCTGTLIGDNTVLTAAHCVKGKAPAALRFVTGVDAVQPTRRFDVAEVRSNPLWSGETAKHDNALLILKQSIVPYATPLPVNTKPLPRALIGQRVQNVGYGATEPGGTGTNSIRWWTIEPVKTFDASTITVDGRGVSSVCSGDSGSPTLYRFEDGIVRVIGTLHGGQISCMGLDDFARVDLDAAWILAGGRTTPARLSAHKAEAAPRRAWIGWAAVGVAGAVAIGAVTIAVARR